MPTTCFRPTPYTDLHLGSLWAAYLNYVTAKLDGDEFVMVLDDLCAAYQATWVQGYPVKVCRERYMEDLEWAGIAPDRVHLSSENHDLHVQANEKLGHGAPLSFGGCALWMPLSVDASPRARLIGTPETCAGADPSLQEQVEFHGPANRSWYYMTCCAVDDIEFRIGGYVAGHDQLQYLELSRYLYWRLGYQHAPRVWFAPPIRRETSTVKESKSVPGTPSIRDLREAGYRPEEILATLRECDVRSFSKGLQCTVIPEGVLEADEVRTLTHRDRRLQQYANGIGLPEDRAFHKHIQREARRQIRLGTNRVEAP